VISRSQLLLMASLVAVPLAWAANPEIAPPASPVKCTAVTSRLTTVREVAGSPDRFNGECVQITGVMHGPHLYDDVDGVYLGASSRFDPSSSGAEIGLSGEPINRFVDNRYVHVDLVGTIGDCEQVRACVHASVPEGEIVFVSGYCHYFDGAFLSVTERRAARGAPFLRQLNGHAEYGNLMPAPADWRHRALIESQAQQFLAALRARDGRKLVDLHSEALGGDDEIRLIPFLLREQRSPFASLRSSVGSPQMIILIERLLPQVAAELSGQERQEAADDYSSTVCFCRTGDCSGRWPIASFDADNLPSRPYACTTIAPYVVYKQGYRLTFNTPVPTEKGGLTEPHWPQSAAPPSAQSRVQ
jgi:hypothetical protein